MALVGSAERSARLLIAAAAFVLPAESSLYILPFASIAKAVVAVVALQEAFEDAVLDVVLEPAEGEAGVAAEGEPEWLCSAQVASIS